MKTKSPEPKPGKSDVTRKVSPRNRIKYSAQQLRRLEKVFMSSQYPDSSILEDLSNTLNIDTERLSIWFQNRRSKFKRQAKGSHVTWMRQQVYPQGAPPSHDRSQPENKCHVLSPPVATSSRKDDAVDKPKSNLHYLPTTSYPSVSEYDEAYNLTSSIHPASSNFYSALTDAVSAPDVIQSTLQLSHIVNDVSSPLPSPSPFPAYPGYVNPSTLTPNGNTFYQSYPPYYTFPNTPMSFTQQLNY